MHGVRQRRRRQPPSRPLTVSLAERARAAASCRLVARKFLMRRRVTIDGVLPDLIDDETRAAGGIDDANGELPDGINAAHTSRRDDGWRGCLIKPTK